MSEEQATSNKENENIGPVEAYHILLQRRISEDRIIVERTSIFLAASSFLFLAFVMLLNPTLAPIFGVLRVILPIAGILLALLVFYLNRIAGNALSFWSSAKRKIEEEATEFSYMVENSIAPEVSAREVRAGRKRWQKTEDGWVLQPAKGVWSIWDKPLQWRWIGGPNKIYWLYLPGIFFILWLAALIVAIISF